MNLALQKWIVLLIWVVIILVVCVVVYLRFIDPVVA